jgi:hypothetical protein
MKLVTEEKHDGKVVTITIYADNEEAVKELLKRIGYTKPYKRGTIQLQLTTF